jgi:predicted porin
MKKTLIALATLAAVGAASAQVTVTGKLGFAYDSDSAVVGKNRGFMMTDGDIVFTAKEDLGSGMSATVSSAMKLRGRDNIGGRDGTITLATPDLILSVGSVEAATALKNAWAGAPVPLTYITTKGYVYDADANLDAAVVTLPLSKEATVSVMYLDFGMAPATFASLNAVQDKAIGATTSLPILGGTPGGGTVQAYVLIGTYATGPISLYGDYTSYISAQATVNNKARTRLTGTYNAGFAQVGLGYQALTMGQAGMYNVGLSVPFGNMVAGVTYAVKEAQSANNQIGAAADVERSVSTLGLTYNLSKQTNVSVGYAVYTGVAAADNEYRIRLMKSF